MKILETERLTIRELNAATDAAFVLELLNSPKFIKYIGDRGVRSVEESREFIENRYRQSYREHGFGLYTVGLKSGESTDNDTLRAARVSASDTATQIGICGFVKRDTLPGPDLGFAFLPEFEGQGYGFESAAAMMKHGRETLGFTKVLAITSLHNDVSGRLLEKLRFKFERLIDSGDEKLKLFCHRVNREHGERKFQ